MSFIRDLLERMKNITAEEPVEKVEETYYEMPKYMNTYLKLLKKYVKSFKADNSLIKEPNVTNFLHTLNKVSVEYERFIEDYNRYISGEYNENSAIIKDMLKKKVKLQEKFRKIYNQTEELAKSSNIGLKLFLDKMNIAFDFDNSKWNRIVGAPTRTYVASDPTLGKN